MSTELNKATAKRFFEDIWNKGNLALLDELALPNMVVHGVPPELPPSLEGLRQFIKMYRTAFPDLQFTLGDLIAEGDKVAVRWTVTGTHTGKLLNFPVLGKKGTVTGITVTRYDEKGKIAENWFEFDQLTMLQQIGVIPVPA